MTTMWSSTRTSRTWLISAVVTGVLMAGGLVGCQRGPDPAASTGQKQGEHKHAAKENHEADKEIEAAMAQLPAEDRPLAAAQGYCVVMQNTRLGEMGPPLKITIKDQPVFLCCKGCKRKAEASPDKTLAKVEEMKAKTKAGDEAKQ